MLSWKYLKPSANIVTHPFRFCNLKPTIKFASANQLSVFIKDVEKSIQKEKWMII